LAKKQSRQSEFTTRQGIPVTA